MLHAGFIGHHSPNYKSYPLLRTPYVGGSMLTILKALSHLILIIYMSSLLELVLF